MLLWNLVDLLDAEAYWIIEVFSIIIGMAIFTRILKRIIDTLYEKYHKKNDIWKEAFIGAAFQPINFYIWCFVIAYSINIISDRFISHQYLQETLMIFYIGGVIALTWYFLKVKNNLVALALERHALGEIKMDQGKIISFGKISTLLIAIISILLLMEVTGQSFKTIIAFGGISGLALAFASQEIISNFFGGMMIHTTNPFSVRDIISLPSNNVEGIVENIGWYQTALRSPDKRPIYIPNSLFAKALVINLSRMSHRRIKELISVRHQDLPVVPSIIKDIQDYLKSNPNIDNTQNILVNISSIDPCSVAISFQAYSLHTDESIFLRIRDDFFVNSCQIINKNNAQLAIPIQEIIS